MDNNSNQKNVFLNGEGDAYHNRNRIELRDGVIQKDFLAPYFRYLNKDSKVLEIGCGNGRNLHYIYENIGCEVYGIEPSKVAIKEGKEIYGEISFFCGTADELPFENEMFDVVFFGTCLYLVDRNLLIKCVAEADRVLKNKGIIGLTEFDSKIPRKNLYKHFDGMKSYKMDYSTAFTVFPHYSLLEKQQKVAKENELLFADVQERMALNILYKCHEDAYVTGNNL